MTETPKGTLVVLYPGCIEFEIMLATEVLNPALPVEVATPNGSDHRGSNGMVIRATCAYADVNPHKYAVVLVPGGDTYEVLENQVLFGLLRAAHQQGALLGAICAGPILLGKAELLVGRRFTHGMADLFPEILAPIWQTGTYVDEQVVVDGNIVTAQPQAHIDFGIELARLAGVIPNEEASKRKNYYKGLKNGVPL